MLIERVRDIVLGVRFVDERITGRITLVGLGRAGKWAALAGPPPGPLGEREIRDAEYEEKPRDEDRSESKGDEERS